MRILGFIFIYFLVGILIIGGIIVFLIGEFIVFFMIWMINWLNGMFGVFKIFLGGILGGMIVLDMGGFINKVVVIFV